LLPSSTAWGIARGLNITMHWAVPCRSAAEMSSVRLCDAQALTDEITVFTRLNRMYAPFESDGRAVSPRLNRTATPLLCRFNPFESDRHAVSPRLNRTAAPLHAFALGARHRLSYQIHMCATPFKPKTNSCHVE